MSAPRHGKSLIVLVAALTMFGPLSIDTMFPAFGAMAEALAVTPLALQQVLSVYLATYTVMALFHGPISDAVGRKPVILVGAGVFTLASIGCVFAQTLDQLLFMRGLQGLSAGAGMIVGRAIVRDIYHGHEAQRVMAIMTMLFGIAPAVAPIIGGLILGLAGWRAIFVFLALFGVLLLVVSALRLPETHAPEARQPLAVRPLLRGYREIFGHPGFRLLSLAVTFNFAALFLYIMSAPAFVMGMMGLSELQFWVFFVPTIAGMMSGAMLSGRLAGRFKGGILVGWAYRIMAVAVVANVAGNLYAAPAAPWAVLPIMVLACGIALAFPVITIGILDLFPQRRGGASSLQTAVSLAILVVVAGVVAPLVFDSGLKLALTSASFTCLGYLFWRLGRHWCVDPAA
ncbi:MAG TPA: multidrug effflux MFS transporter [Xanthomonadaceae bacterium]|nr:multidrug effflux MFS transporter [Xanthomonadaceae bacterium]